MSIDASTVTEQSEEFFACGYGASGTWACALEAGERVVCITDPGRKQAIAFSSPTAAESGGEIDNTDAITPSPLSVTLVDGVMCELLWRDSGHHWREMFSWYACDDGSALLAPEDVAGTFQRGETWTVQRSMDQQEPVVADVAIVTFAGR